MVTLRMIPVLTKIIKHLEKWMTHGDTGASDVKTRKKAVSVLKRNTSFLNSIGLGPQIVTVLQAQIEGLGRPCKTTISFLKELGELITLHVG